MKGKKKNIVIFVIIIIIGFGLLLINYNLTSSEKKIVSLLISQDYEEAQEVYESVPNLVRGKFSKPITEVLVLNAYKGFENDELYDIKQVEDAKRTYQLNTSYWEAEVLSLSSQYYNVHMDNIEMLNNVSCLEENLSNFDQYSFGLISSADYLGYYLEQGDDFNLEMARIFDEDVKDIPLSNCGENACFSDYKEKTQLALQSAFDVPSRENIELKVKDILDETKSLERQAKEMGDAVDEWYDDYIRIKEELIKYESEVLELKNKYF